MANEINKRDANYVTVMTGVTDDASLDISQLRVDPTTKRLKVDQSALTAEIDTVTVSELNDNLSNYKCADIADSTDPNYYGFIDKDGNWYILQNNLANNTFRYVKGTSGYTTAWTNRASQSYDYFYTIF